MTVRDFIKFKIGIKIDHAIPRERMQELPPALK